MISLQSLYEEWAGHSLGKHRALGGRVALGGFLYQLYLSLDYFFDQVIKGNSNSKFLFEGLSDVAKLQDGIIYLTQIKTTLNTDSLRSAVGEALAVWQFMLETHPELKEHVRFQLAAHKVVQSLPKNVGELDAEKLGLKGPQIRLWAEIRYKFGPINICGSPKVDLAIHLWRHVVSNCIS